MRLALVGCFQADNFCLFACCCNSYLASLQAYREQQRPLIYLDETWVNQKHSVPFGWTVDGSDNLPLAPRRGKGPRLIVLAAGGENGLVSQTIEVFPAKKQSGDYHKEMNTKHFLEWWEKKLLPNVPDHAVIIIDRAPYHVGLTEESRLPRLQTKSSLKEWLRTHGVKFDPNSSLGDLVELAKENKPSPVLQVQALALQQNRDILVEVLPAAHCFFDATELVWARVKGQVAKRNVKYTMQEVERLTKEELDNVDASYWRSCMAHVEKEEAKWRAANFGERVVDLGVGGESLEEVEEGVDSEEED